MDANGPELLAPIPKPNFPRAMPTLQRSVPLLSPLAIALIVGLAACDSGGSNNSESPEPERQVAQTFSVTVTSTDGSYPYADQNRNGVAYAIDGEVGKMITLERGKTYEFELGSGVDPNHPFYVAETAEGAGNDAFRSDPAFQTTGTVTFTPPSDAPNSLFYQCGNHVYMGGKMNITESTDDGDDGGGGY